MPKVKVQRKSRNELFKELSKVAKKHGGDCDCGGNKKFGLNFQVSFPDDGTSSVKIRACFSEMNKILEREKLIALNISDNQLGFYYGIVVRKEEL